MASTEAGKPGAGPDEQDAGDHKGPPNLSSAALAPTDVDGIVVRSPWWLRCSDVQEQDQ